MDDMDDIEIDKEPETELDSELVEAAQAFGKKVAHISGNRIIGVIVLTDGVQHWIISPLGNRDCETLLKGAFRAMHADNAD